MHAVIGDELIVKGRHVGDVDREGIIIGIHGEGGAPPYLVRWKDGHQSLFSPSSDTIVEHLPVGPRPRSLGSVPRGGQPEDKGTFGHG